MDSPDTGQPVSVTHIRPKTKDDLERRRDASKAIADASVGMMGRTPDYLNYTFACFAARSDVWARYGNEQGAENLVRVREPHARQRPVAHAHAHQPAGRPLRPRGRPGRRRGLAPQGRGHGERHPRARRAHARDARAVRRRAGRLPGLATCACRTRKYAICFSIPMSTPGLKFVCRDSYSSQRDPWDYPLSTALRRDGRGRDLRRRRDPARPDLPGRRRPAPHGGHHRLALARAHHPPGHDPRLGEARVRVRARPHDGHTDRRLAVRPRAGEARRDLVDDGDDPRRRDRGRGGLLPGRGLGRLGARTSARSSRCAGSCRSGCRARSSCSS